MRTTQIPIFAIYEAAVFPKTAKLSIFGQQKHFIMEIEPCDSLTFFLRFWSFGLHFLITFFLITTKRVPSALSVLQGKGNHSEKV